VRVIVLDDRGEGVVTPDVLQRHAEPALLGRAGAHYGAVALPCRVRNPDREGTGATGSTSDIAFTRTERLLGSDAGRSPPREPMAGSSRLSEN
jgi:hypothetical protein